MRTKELRSNKKSTACIYTNTKWMIHPAVLVLVWRQPLLATVRVGLDHQGLFPGVSGGKNGQCCKQNRQFMKEALERKTGEKLSRLGSGLLTALPDPQISYQSVTVPLEHK